uniref:CSON008871 protein n=1 Tax=Culicoides sonorensis TaxID=179676 RepID=A0A336LZF0_CULSO
MASTKLSQNHNVKVMVKVRPLINREKENGEVACWEKVSDKEIRELDVVSPAHPYIYDQVFGATDSSALIYETEISHIVDSCVQGFNGSVMAYGQTASGKTYTMMGNEMNPGIIRLVAQNIFDIIEQHDDKDIYIVRCSFLEIYNEKVNDLLNPEMTNLDIVETPDGTVMIKNASEKVVKKAQHIVELIEFGNATKRMGETAANDRSSRSHTIFRIMIESQGHEDEKSSIKMGTLDLVDLAGSESINKTKASGDRLKEGISINRSLLELGRVIKELSEKKEGEEKFIVFRNSKLTRVIQHSLGGNAKSVVICTVSPAERDETKNTLRFASRAKNVKNSPKLNEIVSDQAMIKRLNHELVTLRKQIEDMSRNQGQNEPSASERIRQDIIDRIAKCEMQFIRSKKHNQRKKELRRQTWHHLGGTSEKNNTELIDIDQENSRELMPPPPPIFTLQRGSNAIHTEDTFNFPSVNHDEFFEPGEMVTFNSTPSPKMTAKRIHTPKTFRRRLPSIAETPPIGSTPNSCDRCKFLENELEELTDFTKVEQVYHVHEDAEKPNCNATIKQLREELEETQKLLEMSNVEINSLKVNIESALRSKDDAIKSQGISESHSAGVEYELELLKAKYEKREKELLELLQEKTEESKLIEQTNDEMKLKIKSIEQELFDLQMKFELERQANEKAGLEASIKHESLRHSIMNSMSPQNHEKEKTLNGSHQSLKPNNTICGDDLMCDFTFNSTGGCLKENNLSHLDESVKKINGTVIESTPIKNNEQKINEQLMLKMQEIESLSNELEIARSDIKELKKKNKALQAEHDDISMQLVEAIQDSDAFKTELEKFKKISTVPQTIDNKITDLNSNLEKVFEEKCELQAQLHQATKQIESFKQELNELRATLEELVPIVAEKDKLDHEHQEMKKELQEIQSELIEKSNEIQSLKQSLEEKDQQLTATETESSQKLNTQETEIENLQQALKEMSDSIEKEEKDDISELKCKIDTLEAERDTIKQQLNSINTENAELISEIERLKSDIEAKELKITDLILADENLNEKLRLQEEEIEKLKSEIQNSIDIEFKLNEKTEEIEKLLKDLEEKESRITELTATELHLKEKLEGHVNEIEALKCVESSENRENTENDELKLKLDSLGKEVETAKHQIIKSESENSELLSQINELQKNLESTKNDLDRAFQEIETQKQISDNKETQINELNQKLKSQTENLEVLLKESAEIESDLNIKTEKIATLQKELEDRETKINDFQMQIENLSKESNEPQETAEIDDISELKSKLETFEKSSEEAKSQLIEKETENSELKSKITELESNLERLNAEKIQIHETLEKSSENANSQLIEKETENSELKLKIKELELNLERLNAEKIQIHETLEKSSEDANSQLIEKETENSELKSKITELELNLERLNAEKIQINEVLEKSSEDAKSQLIEKETKNLELKSKIEALQSNLEQINTEKIQINEALTSEMDNSKKLSSELEMIQKRLEESENELNVIKTSMADLETKFTEKSNECLAKEEKIKDLSKLVDEIKCEKESSNDSEITSLTNSLIEARSDLDKKSQEWEEKSKKLEENLSKALQEKTQCEEKLTSLKQELLESLEKLDQQFTLNSDLNSELSSLKTEVEKLKTNLMDCENQVDTLLNEKEALEEQLIKHQESVNSFESKIGELTKEIEGLNNEKSSILLELDQIQMSRKESLTTIEGLKHENSNLTKKLSYIEETCNSKDAEIEKLQHELSGSTEKSKKCHEEQMKQLQSEIQALHQEKFSNSSKLDEINAEHKKSLIKIDTLNSENSDLIMKLSTVEEELAVKDDQLSELKSKYEQALNEIDSQKISLLEKSTKVQTQCEEISSLQQSLLQKDQLLQQLNEKVKQHDLEREQHRFELEDLRKRTITDRRRSRRESAHDELRPLVRSLKAIACQTEPTDENCQCVVLNEKLEKMKVELLRAKVTADHYRHGNDMKVGDMKEEKERVEKKLKEAMAEVNRLGNETNRIRGEREALREKLMQIISERKTCAVCHERSNRKISCREVQTDLEVPIVSMNSDAVSLEQKMYIKKLEDDLAITSKKYQECKLVAQDRREKIKEKEAEISALKNNRSPEGGKENISNNVQISQLKNDLIQLKKENIELVQHYKHYKSLYMSKMSQQSNSNKKSDGSSQTDPINCLSPEDYKTLTDEREMFETKYRRAAVWVNQLKENIAIYQSKFVERVAEVHACYLALSKYTDIKPTPTEQMEEIYRKGYEKYRKDNPDFIRKYVD